jgi:CubicO group peptidase (beta-lactamase class C family)
VKRRAPGSGLRAPWRTALAPALAIACALLVAPRPAAAQGIPADFDAYVERVRQAFDVPGIAVAVVKDGGVVLAKGYGVKRLGAPDPVDADTRFGIASNSKAFTTAALAMLVDEGKLAWDDPVSRHLPAFAMYDPYVSKEITVRDLVTHRAGLGLGAGDLLWWPPTSYSRDEIVRRARFVKPASSVRSRYAYNNVLFLVAGQVVAAVSGTTWDDFVRTRILAPLGMTRTTTSVGDRAGDNVASPHPLVNGAPSPNEPWPFDNIGPAASINSTANDLAKWAIAQLDRGAVRGNANGARLWSEAQSREMWSAQTVQRVSDPHPALAALKPAFAAYGLGWALAAHRGHTLVSHGGALPGYYSRVMLVPDIGLGIVVLTNQETSEAFQSVVWTLVDAYTGAAATDWIPRFRQSLDASLAEERTTLAAQAKARATGTTPSLPLERYAGTYRDPWYGDVTVGVESGHLVLRFTKTPRLTGDLEHWQHDTFLARWRDRTLNADAYVTFALNADATIRDVRLAPQSPRADFSFDFQDLQLTPAPPAGKTP